MALYDHDQAGPAANYLRLPDLELLTVRTAEFAGRKAIWIPHKDDEKSYVKGINLGEGKKPGTKSIEFEGTTKDYKVKFICIEIIFPFTGIISKNSFI